MRAARGLIAVVSGVLLGSLLPLGCSPTGDDYFNKMVGHNVLLNDLYALNGGGPR